MSIGVQIIKLSVVVVLVKLVALISDRMSPPDWPVVNEACRGFSQNLHSISSLKQTTVNSQD